MNCDVVACKTKRKTAKRAPRVHAQVKRNSSTKNFISVAKTQLVLRANKLLRCALLFCQTAVVDPLHHASAKTSEPKLQIR